MSMFEPVFERRVRMLFSEPGPHDDTLGERARALWREGLYQTFEATGIPPAKRAALADAHARERAIDLADPLALHWDVPAPTDEAAPTAARRRRRAFFVVEDAPAPQPDAPPPRLLGMIGVRECPQGSGRLRPRRHARQAATTTTASIWRLTVAEHARGAGLGARLLGAAEAFARDAGFERVVLQTSNPVAVRFYERRGYAKIPNTTKDFYARALTCGATHRDPALCSSRAAPIIGA